MKVLLLNQAFYPDVVSTAQHAGNLAVELAKRGHSVTTLANRRAYDNPNLRFAKMELWKGVNIIRIPCSSFGKKAKWRRALDFGTFLISCAIRLLLLPGFDVVIAMTSPPLMSMLAALFVKLKGGRLVLWVMDLNPDEAVAAGWLRKKGSITKLLTRLLVYSLRRADQIVALDRFMKERILLKAPVEERIAVIPPWSHDGEICFNRKGRYEFRHKYGLAGKYVVMYSGNHSPCHPLDTLLHAANQLSHHHQIIFCFVGGGSQFPQVKNFAAERQLANIVCLPYQPMNKLSASLSAADLHVVVMGDPFVGIVHPCKIYNILILGIPFLYIGPSPSHVSDVIPPEALGTWARTAKHGDVEGVVRHILAAAKKSVGTTNSAEIELSRNFSGELLIPRVIHLLEPSAPRESVAASRGSTGRFGFRGLARR